MRWGIFSGALWGMDTVTLGLALLFIPFLNLPDAALASAMFHDVLCAIILFIYMLMRGRLRASLKAITTRAGQAVMIAAILGGPIGMTGYLVAINNIGPGFTAIISTFYPAFGAVLAYIFLKERMGLHQLVALLISLVAIILIGWSSASTTPTGSTMVGVVAALTCVIGWGSEAVILAWGMNDDDVDNDTALHIRQTTSALAYLFVIAPVTGTFSFVKYSMLNVGIGVVVIAAMAGTASYLFYYRAIHTIGASRAMALNISYSAWAVFFAFLVLGQVPSLLQIVCCVVILCGTVLAATPDWRILAGDKSGGVCTD
ncbi:DMT family transporter [Arcanobacterium ihumii]|uniref:DMT family transporter n=1 Tax=Arcanobacterium ihumii TaxID=2138162 RepID=UPI000F522F39|nr:DMT family transporter [Arcanobacterium ihumii]